MIPSYQLFFVSLFVFFMGMVCIAYQKRVVGVVKPVKIQSFVFLVIYWAWVLSFISTIVSFAWIVRTY